jgi:hypothetical protein
MCGAGEVVEISREDGMNGRFLAGHRFALIRRSCGEG